MQERVNAHLPDDMQVLDMEKVTLMFCARTTCDKMRYQYMVPSYMMCSEKEVREAFPAVVDATHPRIVTRANVDAIFSDESAITWAREILVRHRVTPEQMGLLREGLILFEGTHCVHNYTRCLGAYDVSSYRNIIS
jgi:tRNA U38,U39,U40 pseudouridine synthase TruA